MIITKTSFFTKLSIFMALSAGFQPCAQSMSSLSGLEGRGGWGAAVWGGCAMLAGYFLYQRFSTPLPDSELVVTLESSDATYERISQLIGQGYTKSALRLIGLADFKTLRQKPGSTNLFTQALNLGHDDIALAILAKVPKVRDTEEFAHPDLGLLKVVVFPDLPMVEYSGKKVLSTAIRNSKTNSDIQRVRFLVKYDIAGCASDKYAEPYTDIEDALGHAGPTVPAGMVADVEFEIRRQQQKIRSEIEQILSLAATRKYCLRGPLTVCRAHSKLARQA